MVPLDVSDSVLSNQCFTAPLKLELAAVESTPVKRRVRFQKGKPAVINLTTEYLLDDEMIVRWWLPDEVDRIRESSRRLSSFIRKKYLSEDVSMAHRKTTLMLASDFKALLKLSRTTPDQDLRIWNRSCDGARGLERYACKDYACFRRKDITNTRTVVLAEQARQRQDRAHDSDAISLVAKEASRRARTFAHMMGEADARVESLNKLEREESKERERDEPMEREGDAPLRVAPPRKRSKIAHDAKLSPLALSQIAHDADQTPSLFRQRSWTT